MRLLIVDDSRSSLALIGSVVKDLMVGELELCLSPLDALSKCDQRQFDLVIVDHIMPEMDGIAFTAALRSRPAYRIVPVIMVTSDLDKSVRIESIKAGATDFLHKPFDATELQARVSNLLALRQAQVELADRAQWLTREVERATAHLLAREEEIIYRLARAIEYRDGDTGEHVSRVAQISQLIAEGIGLPPDRCRMIYLAAPLHDIGKIGIADAILLKPGRLTAEEYEEVRRHAELGAQIVEDVLTPEQVLWIRGHHERPDGRGYPDGLTGEALSEGAALMALADAFDVMTAARPYSTPKPHDVALAECRDLVGRQFTAEAVEALEALERADAPMLVS